MAKKRTLNATPDESNAKVSSRGKVKSDFPKHTLEEALRVPKALEEANGGRPLPPIETATALGISPGSSEFRTLLSSSIKYGLTSGSFNQERIALSDSGRRIVEPTTPEERHKATIEAALLPSTFRAIYDYYKGKKLPEKTFFENSVVREFEIPRDHAPKSVEVFNANMEKIGLVRVATTGRWLSTEAVFPSEMPETADTVGLEDEHQAHEPEIATPYSGPKATRTVTVETESLKRRVFVAHGKNRHFLEPIKKLLGFGDLVPLVSVERPSVSQPLPDKVFNEMRSCGAAIIHVDAEMLLNDSEGKEFPVLNPNVLIEIGAAIALYGRRFILLVREGVKLPSDLQGLFIVGYQGDLLDSDATIRLLEAINDIKNHPVPDRYFAGEGVFTTGPKGAV
jgi:predicted nucleotide-binding protein